jgi:hypothetical protein
MNTTRTTLKKIGGTELISTVRSLHIGLFYYIGVLFNRWYRVVFCTVKNLNFYTSAMIFLPLSFPPHEVA